MTGNAPLRSTAPQASMASTAAGRPGEEGAQAKQYFQAMFASTHMLHRISKSMSFFPKDHEMVVATWLGFWALLHVTCANYVLTPIRDAAALQVGVRHMPNLTLASSVLAFLSSVPIGWLFEAPDPKRRKVWKKMGLTRGETQGTSLALFYRFFALCLISYAIGFSLAEWLPKQLGWTAAADAAETSAAAFAQSANKVSDGTGGNIAEASQAPLQILWDSLKAMAGSATASSSSTTPDASMSVGPSIHQQFADALYQTVAIVWTEWVPYIMGSFGQSLYIAFFLVVHLMKLHSLSLVWGVTTEAMEYEEVARDQQRQRQSSNYGFQSTSTSSSLSTLSHNQQQQQSQESEEPEAKPKSKTRLQRLGFVGFGGTLGGILGSVLASTMANVLHLPGLLILAAVLLEVSAHLSIELGRIMQHHWEEQQALFVSTTDLASLDTSMRRTSSFGSMKRVASGNSIMQLKRINSSSTSLNALSNANGSGRSHASHSSSQSLSDLANSPGTNAYRTDGGNPSGMASTTATESAPALSTAASPSIQARQSSLSSSSLPSPSPASPQIPDPPADDNTFTQRLMRGITTILKSRLLMAIFTYNALYASTTTLLSFQRAALVANRKIATAASSSSASASVSSVNADTAFLAKINMASSVAIFVMQASGLGAIIAQTCGAQGALALMPLVRLMGVVSLAWWHRASGGHPPNLILFLLLDECTRVINMGVAKPVRESLWRGLSNEARYEAKPIVDTLANRWGGGSAAFMVAMINKLIMWVGAQEEDAGSGEGVDGSNGSGGFVAVTADVDILGFPPVIFLCLIVAVWWAVVSVDLGHVRKRIDLELKKRQ